MGDAILVFLDGISTIKLKRSYWASTQTPPSLEELAQQVGLDVRKLSGGFRRVYGSTVFGFLQEYRLEQA